MNKKSGSHPKKFVIHEGDGEFFTSDGQPLSRDELAKRRARHQANKKDWEFEMSLRRDEMSRTRTRG